MSKISEVLTSGEAVDAIVALLEQNESLSKYVAA